MNDHAVVINTICDYLWRGSGINVPHLVWSDSTVKTEKFTSFTVARTTQNGVHKHTLPTDE